MKKKHKRVFKRLSKRVDALEKHPYLQNDPDGVRGEYTSPPRREDGAGKITVVDNPQA